jgi:hypothetical protein
MSIKLAPKTTAAVTALRAAGAQVRTLRSKPAPLASLPDPATYVWPAVARTHPPALCEVQLVSSRE